MTQTQSKSVIVVGGGIVGLTVAVVLQASGHKITLIERDAPEDTASGVAAGMIAPALEALGDADPVMSYARLKRAQAAWNDLIDIWPPSVQVMLAEAQLKPSVYRWHMDLAMQEPQASIRKRLLDMSAAHEVLDWDATLIAGFDPEYEGAARIHDDWLIEAIPMLQALRMHILAHNGHIVRGEVHHITSHTVRSTDGNTYYADEVVIAAGFGARHMAMYVPSLRVLEPIKGHLLDIEGQGGGGVVRSPHGYLADYGRHAKFGASMQPGQSDAEVEPAVIADLKRRAAEMNIDLPQEAVPAVGIRATTPDGWPLIGRDPRSGVLVATGMRRNGYIFAPLAAKIILALIAGDESPDGGLYRPDRFD